MSIFQVRWTMATIRIDMTVDEGIKVAAEKAAALKGMRDLTEYVVRLIEQDAGRVIREHSTMVVEDDAFDRFMAACVSAAEPNQKLRDARDFAKEQGFLS